MAENKLVSNGIYSIMNNSWIKEPVQAKIPDLDKEVFNKEFKIWEDRYNEIIDLEEEIHTPQIDEIDSFLDDVYVMRQNSLNTEGEYGIGNLVFKELRNKGYLDNLKEMRNELISKELSLESLTEVVNGLDKLVLKEDQEFGKYKDKFIRTILSQDTAALHKGAESRKIYNRQTGELEDKLLWDSVLHHIDGDHENNPFDFSNYTLIQCDNYSTAMLIHRLIHLLSFAENGTAAEDIKNKIRHYDAEFITLINNRLNIQDFDSWWKDSGHIILDSVADKIANMQPGKKIVLENLNKDRNKGYLDSKKLSLKEGAITGNIRDISRDELVKLEKALYDFLAEDHIYPEDGTFNKGRLTDFELVLYIDGDWKHDHLATVQAVEDFCDIYNLTIVNHTQQEIGNNDSDTYKAEHKWQIEIDEDGNTKGTVNSLKKMFATEDITEDTIKRNGNWVNKGKDGTHGAFKTKKAADAQRKAMFANGYHEDLDERLDERQRRQYREEIGRISFNQAIIQDSGLFNIYNVREDDADRIIRKLRNLDYIEWVNKTAGKYDFSKVVMFGQPQPRYYNITGKIKD